MKRRGHTGFTIIEVLVAALILVSVTPLVMSAFVSANRWLKPTRGVATNVVRDQLEELHLQVRGDTWDSPSSALSVGNHVSPLGKQGGYDKVYLRSYTVEDVPNRPFRKVKVKATWDP